LPGLFLSSSIIQFSYREKKSINDNIWLILAQIHLDYSAILSMNMSLRGVLPGTTRQGRCVLSRSSLLITGDCFVGKSKYPPRNDISEIAVDYSMTSFPGKF
jgi:hypothetical protein